MMDISKYMTTHENVFKPNIEIIKNETLSLQMAKMISGGFKGVYEITEEQWKALGTPRRLKQEKITTSTLEILKRLGCCG